MNEYTEDFLVGSPSVDHAMGGTFLAKVFLRIFLILAILFPKIYIQTQIYFKSREISALNREHDALLEENRIIKAKVEAMRYKNTILDTLF